MPRHVGSAGGELRPRRSAISHLPAKSAPLSQPQGEASIVSRRGPGALPKAEEIAQACPALGRSLCHKQGPSQQGILPVGHAKARG